MRIFEEPNNNNRNSIFFSINFFLCKKWIIWIMPKHRTWWWLTNKGTCRIMDLADPADQIVKKRHVLRPCQNNEKAVEHEGYGDTSWYRRTWKSLQRLEKKSGRVVYQRTDRENPRYIIVKIGFNTEMIVSLSSVKYYQLTPVWRTHKEWNNTQKRPRDLARLAVTLSSLEDHYLWFEWKTRNE